MKDKSKSKLTSIQKPDDPILEELNFRITRYETEKAVTAANEEKYSLNQIESTATWIMQFSLLNSLGFNVSDKEIVNITFEEKTTVRLFKSISDTGLIELRISKEHKSLLPEALIKLCITKAPVEKLESIKAAYIEVLETK